MTLANPDALVLAEYCRRTQLLAMKRTPDTCSPDSSCCSTSARSWRSRMDQHPLRRHKLLDRFPGVGEPGRVDRQAVPAGELHPPVAAHVACAALDHCGSLGDDPVDRLRRCLRSRFDGGKNDAQGSADYSTKSMTRHSASLSWGSVFIGGSQTSYPRQTFEALIAIKARRSEVDNHLFDGPRIDLQDLPVDPGRK